MTVRDGRRLITDHRQCSRRAASLLSGEGFDMEPHEHWSLTQHPESQPEDLREGQKGGEKEREKDYLHSSKLHQAVIAYCTLKGYIKKPESVMRCGKFTAWVNNPVLTANPISLPSLIHTQAFSCLVCSDSNVCMNGLVMFNSQKPYRLRTVPLSLAPTLPLSTICVDVCQYSNFQIKLKCRKKQKPFQQTNRTPSAMFVTNINAQKRPFFIFTASYSFYRSA